jgi:apolipoprotein D and lipocalin family protein
MSLGIFFKQINFVRMGAFLMMMGCSTTKFDHTVSNVDIPRFMGTWYVWAGRTTFLERGAYASVEKYSWNTERQRIDIDFVFNKDSFDGKQKSIPQKAWIVENSGNARWKVQPFWPLKFDYLVIALAEDYSWTAIGVPNGKYVWIMGRQPVVTDQKLTEITEQLVKLGYPMQDVVRVPQRDPIH